MGELDVAGEEKVGIYVSVPFCRAKCSFCNFASGVGTAAAIEQYVESLCAEVDHCAAAVRALGGELPRSADSVYFGGGTPSLLTPGQLRRVFSALRRTFDTAADAEITLEAAPGQIADDVLEEGMRLGVNRVSLGVQSFVDREAAAVGRQHTGEQCVAEIARLRAAGIERVGADLIAGLPYQTETSWQSSLDAAVACSLDHLSVYMLEVDEDSRLGAEVMAGGVRFHAHGVPTDDLSADMYEMACERLSETGFVQYEISNFAKSGNRSRHNCKYWTRAPYVGFGLDAHSMLRTERGAVRWANAEELAAYGLPGSRGERRVVGEREAFEETVFLGLRMTAGIGREELAGFAREWVEEFAERAAEMVRGGMMAAGEGRWRLTARGRVVSNAVFGELLDLVAV